MKILIKTQPDDTSCGPTSLHAVYRYYDNDVSLNSLIDEIKQVKNGGTIAPDLGIHAIKAGFKAKIYTYNLDVFDPTWFYPKPLSPKKLIEKLTAQLAYKQLPKVVESINAYVQFLSLGGAVLFKDLSVNLLKTYFDQKIPIIVGLSATYLYRCSREFVTPAGECLYDDLKGEPCGHFVVLCGYDETKRHIIVADPHRENPISKDNYYKVSVGRLINSIMLGHITYDGNMLIIEKDQ